MEEKLLNHYHYEAIGKRERSEFVEWLENQEHVVNVRTRRRCIDFQIGGYDIWPRYSKDEHLNAITSSSVANNHFGAETVDDEKFVTEIKIHLPPAPEELEDDIEEVFDLPDELTIFHGTTALGGMPAPNGVITPHVFHTEDVTFEIAQEGAEQALEVYEDVYNEGEKAIKEKPE